MSKVKNKNTDIELLLRSKLWSLGYRYRVNHKMIGNPDIVFLKNKITIFCDGDFWHGRTYNADSKKYKTFWKDKIAKNIARDNEVNKKLKSEGWRVLRFWKTEILKSPDMCIKKITECLLR